MFNKYSITNIKDNWEDKSVLQATATVSLIVFTSSFIALSIASFAPMFTVIASIGGCACYKYIKSETNVDEGIVHFIQDNVVALGTTCIVSVALVSILPFTSKLLLATATTAIMALHTMAHDKIELENGGDIPYPAYLVQQFNDASQDITCEISP